MQENPKFIHLRVHSEYSLLEGAIRIKELPSMCFAMGMPAVAVTDTNNLFGALEFSEYSSNAGIQPILGCQMSLCFTDSASVDTEPDLPSIVLLVQNEVGYKNLLKLNSKAYLEKEGSPFITMEDLRGSSAGLIALTGGVNGPVGKLLISEKTNEAHNLLLDFLEIFQNNLYIEIQRHPSEGGVSELEVATESHFIKLAYKLKIPLVATNDVFFPDNGMFEAHDALMCISSGAYVDQRESRRRLTPQHFFKTQEEMLTLFADLPEATANTVEIAKRCAFKAETREPILPKFAENENQELRTQALAGLNARLDVIQLAVPVSEYQSRLEFELKVINEMGFPGYFLIVADFIQWAKSKQIPVGPGRGSGAGSLVAYALTITDLDPLRYSLLFESFLNP